MISKQLRRRAFVQTSSLSTKIRKCIEQVKGFVIFDVDYNSLYNYAVNYHKSLVITTKTNPPNPDIEKVDVTGYEDLERFFRRGIPYSSINAICRIFTNPSVYGIKE